MPLRAPHYLVIDIFVRLTYYKNIRLSSLTSPVASLSLPLRSPYHFPTTPLIPPCYCPHTFQSCHVTSWFRHLRGNIHYTCEKSKKWTRNSTRTSFPGVTLSFPCKWLLSWKTLNSTCIKKTKFDHKGKQLHAYFPISSVPLSYCMPEHSTAILSCN